MKRRSKYIRLLVVDDHDIVREGLRALISTETRWQICGEAADGRKAVELAKKLKPDIVLLDISMPELNGLEATRQIRRALPSTEILVLTVHESAVLAQEVFEAGGRGFIVKTDVKRFLIPALECLSEHKPFFSSKISELILLGDPSAQGTRPPDANRPRQRLTSRETEVLQLVAEGRSNKEIAAKLGRSIKTVEAHRASIMRRLDLTSVAELVRYAIRHKIVEN